MKKLNYKFYKLCLRNLFRNSSLSSRLDERKAVVYTSPKINHSWAKDHHAWTAQLRYGIIGSDCLFKKVKYSASVMIWGCMSARSVDKLHFIDGTMKKINISLLHQFRFFIFTIFFKGWGCL